MLDAEAIAELAACHQLTKITFQGSACMNDESTTKLLVEMRDKHLAQLMAINGQAVFLVLGLLFTVVTAIDKLQELKGNWFFFCTLLAGAALLAIAAFRMSSFHTTRIRRFEVMISKTSGLSEEDSRIIPHDEEGKPWKYPFHYTFVGTVLLVAAILSLLFR
jgi:hypothetical protein